MRIRDLTFLRSTKKRYIPASFILLVVSDELDPSVFNDDGYALLRFAKDQITYVWTTCFRRYDVLTKSRSKMATAISFSRQNKTGSLARALYLLRKLVVELVLALGYCKEK